MRFFRAPQTKNDGAQPRQQFPLVERLGEIIVGADFQPDDPVDRIVFRRDDQDRQARPAGAQALAYFQPILAGQHQVEDQAIEPFQHAIDVETGRIFHGQNFKPLTGQQHAHQISNAGIILDNRDLAI